MPEKELEQLKTLLNPKGMQFRLTDAETLTDAWDMAFCAAVAPQELDGIHYEDFRWHLFSYDKLAAKTGDEARAALAEKSSQRLFLFFQHLDRAYELRQAYDLDAADVDAVAEICAPDVYVFDADGCWTYVRTHEAACGPYFFQW